MLPDDNGILVQVGDVGAANALGVLLHDHPSEMRVEETLANGVRVLVGIGVAMMAAMSGTPPPGTALHGTSTRGSEENPERKLGLV